MNCEIEIAPVLICVDFLYRVAQYLRGDVPLDYVRRWQVERSLDRQNLNSVEMAFIQRFEGAYAEYTDFPGATDKEKYLALEQFKRRIHQAICGWQDGPHETGTNSEEIPNAYER